MTNKRLIAFFMACVMLVAGVRWPKMTVRAEETVGEMKRASAAEAGRATASAADWEEEGDLCIDCIELDMEELNFYFETNQVAAGAGTLDAGGVSVWYLNYMPDTREKNYNYQVLDADGDTVDQTWWNYWWEEEPGGWRIQAKPTQYSYDRQDYRYFILDEEGILTTNIPAVIDGKPVVSMDHCFSAWPLPMTDPGQIPETVVSAERCYQGTAIQAMPELPEGLVNMNYMFYECSDLVDTVPIPAGAEQMDYAFSCSGIVETPGFLGSGKIRELKNTFSYCTSLERIGELPEGVEKLDQTFWCAFAKGADLRGDVIPESVTVMEDTFFNANIRYAPQLPPGLGQMDGCFQDCSGLREVPLLPDSVVSAKRAFAYCSGLQLASPEHVYVAAPKSMVNADKMFMAAYRTAGRPDAYGRDSELLYLWDEQQWESIYRQVYGEMPVDRDAWGDYILPVTPVGLTCMELLDTAPYINTALVAEDGKRAVQLLFNGVFGTYGEEPDYYPGDRIQYRIDGAGDFRDWDGTPVFVYEDAVVEARKVREITIYDGVEQVVSKVRTKNVSVSQPEAPVFSYKYIGKGRFDVTIMYQPHLRSISRVELKYRVNDSDVWKDIENLGHVTVACEDVIYAYADWGAVSDTAALKLPDYVKSIRFENPDQYTGMNSDIPVLCSVLEQDAADRSYTVDIVEDDSGIAEVASDGNGGWKVRNAGYGTVRLRATANDGSGVTADHTLRFVSRVTDIKASLKNNPSNKLNIGDMDEVVVNITPSALNEYEIFLNNDVLAYDEGSRMVTALKPGRAALTATSTIDPSLSDCIIIDVLPRPGSISVQPEAVTLYSDETVAVTCSWKPSGATRPEVLSEGVETAVNLVETEAGNVQGTVTAADSRDSGQTSITFYAAAAPEVKGVCRISWKPFIHHITLNGPDQMPSGSTDAVTAETDVESDETLYYESSDADILAVDQDGKLTAGNKGTAIITVTTSHGKRTAEKSIQVTEAAEKDITALQLTVEKPELVAGEKTTCQVTTEPQYTSGAYTVTSSAPDIVEVGNDGELMAKSPGAAVIRAEESADPAGEEPAYDEKTVTVMPNRSAILSIGPTTGLWEREGRTVAYKNLAGGQAIDFQYEILTDAADKTVTWSVDNEELAEIDQNGRLKTKRNGMVTVQAASNAYPEVKAVYLLEIRTVATDITYSVIRNEGEMGPVFTLSAAKYPEDASPEHLYYFDSWEYHKIIHGTVTITNSNYVKLSTCDGAPSIEDYQTEIQLYPGEFKPVIDRYELRSFHDEEPYTIYTSDIDDRNMFRMGIYDTVEKRYLDQEELTGIKWTHVSFFCEPMETELNINFIDCEEEQEGILQLCIYGDQLNNLNSTIIDVSFKTTGIEQLSQLEYKIRSCQEKPSTIELRCLDKVGQECYSYDLSKYERGIPEYHLGEIGTNRPAYTAANSKYSECTLDINGETFISMEACLNRYAIKVTLDNENVTNKVLRGLSRSGRPQIIFLGNGNYKIDVLSIESGAASSKEALAHGGTGFVYMYLCSPEEHPSYYSYSNTCYIKEFQGSNTVYAVGVPFKGTPAPGAELSGDQWSAAASKYDNNYLLDSPYELTLELLPDHDGVIRGTADKNKITAKGYTTDTYEMIYGPRDLETIKATLTQDGKVIAYIYGVNEIYNQIPELRLTKNGSFECGQENTVSITSIPQSNLESIVTYALGSQKITGAGSYDGFEVTRIEDGVIGLCFNEIPKFSKTFYAYYDGDKLFELAGDASLKGKTVSETYTSLDIYGTSHASIDDITLNVGTASTLNIQCGVGDRSATGTIKSYKVLNAAGAAPLTINGKQLTADRPGEWLVQATVSFYSSKTWNVNCQFKVTIKNPANALTIGERSHKTTCFTGESLYFVPGYLPLDADNVKGYEWSIEDSPSGVTISQDGVAAAREAGTYTVILKDLPSKSLRASYQFTVEDPPVKAAGVTVTPKTGECSNTEKLQLTAAVTPEHAVNKAVTWTAYADRGSAVISQEGEFTGRKAGTYTIRAALSDNPEVYDEASIQVKVLPERIYISGDTYIDLNAQTTLQAEVLPEDAAYQSIRWEITTGGELAEIAQDGTVTAKNTVGKVQVKATIEGTDISAEQDISIGKVLPSLVADLRDQDGNPKGEISSRNDLAYLHINGVRATKKYVEKNGYSVHIAPENAGVILDSMGALHGVNEGLYTITASQEVDGYTISDTAPLAVLNDVRYDYLIVRPKDGDYTITEWQGKKELEYVLSPALKPEDTAGWKIVGGSELADLTETGTLTAKGLNNGPVTVECSIKNKESGEVYLTQYCTIVLQNQYIGVTGIQVKCQSPVYVGDSVGISVQVSPENVNNREYRLDVSDILVGRIEDGQLIALQPGEIMITAVSVEDETYSDSVIVTVLQKTEDGAGGRPEPEPGPEPQSPAGSHSSGDQAEDNQWQYWILRDGNWYYYHSNGIMAEQEWVMYRDQWYWLQNGGIMLSNAWLSQGDKTFYLGNNGAMATDSWVRIEDSWYYFDGQGQVNESQARLTGFTVMGDQLVYRGTVEGCWIQIGPHTYYIDDRKYVGTNRWIRDGENWYYVGGNGFMLRGQWNEVKGQWYYMNPDGRMEKVSTVWEGNTYKMDGDGAARNTGR